MPNYIHTNRAVHDLSAIWDFTFDHWSETQADIYYGMLIDTFQELSRSPQLGKPYDGIGNGILGFRVGRHVIFYKAISGKQVQIIRILHQQMDLKNRLGE